MHLPELRTIQIPADPEDAKSMRRMFDDIQYNFRVLMLAARVDQRTLPVSPNVSLLVLTSTGDFQLWSLVSGGGVTITPNAATKTLTITSP